jgi:Flp pilus assembly protein TadG
MKMPAIDTLIHRNRRNEKGQVLIIVVFAIIGLVAFVGLVVDLGLVYISYGQLRRSVDAAALAASLQYREGYTISDLQTAATEFLVLNGINDPSATIQTCAETMLLCDTNGDGTVTDNEHRKFVHVIASTHVKLAFLPVIGIDNIPLTAEAVSEAASVDVVIAIDRSESMTFDAPPGSDMRDPSQCNAADAGGIYPGDCSPFEDVKVAAVSFVDNLFLDDDGSGPHIGYDRVGVVTFDRNIHCSTCSNAGDGLSLALTTDKNQILHVIRHLWVYQAGNDALPGVDVGYNGETCNDFPGYYSNPRYSPGPVPSGPCRLYDDATQKYQAFDCPTFHIGSDASSCTTTNIGGGLLAAGNEFAESFRKESLWVVILLTDGAANASTDASGNLPFGFCPDATKDTNPFCRDNEYAGMVLGVPKYVNTRHCYDRPGVTMDNRSMCLDNADPTWDFAGVLDDGTNYDADDFARDMADWLVQNNVLSFSIGLGDLVTGANQADPTKGDPRDGEQLLKYVAGVTGGLYFFAPSGSQLREIFAQIADNIATRLTR